LHSRIQGSRRRPRALLRRIRSSFRLPRRIDRHLPHLTHAFFRGSGDHHRLVDPRLELAHGRHGAARHQPVLRRIAFRPLDKQAI
jgi:hypothetical protein